MIAKIKSLFSKPEPKQQLNLFEAIDQSMKFGYHSVNWEGVRY